MSDSLAPHADRAMSAGPTPPAALVDVDPRARPLTIAPALDVPTPVAAGAPTPYGWPWPPTLMGAPLGTLVGLVTLVPAWIALRYLLNPAAAGLIVLLVAIGAGGAGFWLLVAQPWRPGRRFPRLSWPSWKEAVALPHEGRYCSAPRAAARPAPSLLVTPDRPNGYA